MSSPLISAGLCVSYNGVRYDLSIDRVKKLWPWLYHQYYMLWKINEKNMILIIISTKIPRILIDYIAEIDVGKEQRIEGCKAIQDYPIRDVIPRTPEFAKYLYGKEDGLRKHANYLVETITGSTIYRLYKKRSKDIYPDKPVKFRVHRYEGYPIPDDKELTISLSHINIRSENDMRPFVFKLSEQKGDISLISDQWIDWPCLDETYLKLLEA